MSLVSELLECASVRKLTQVQERLRTELDELDTKQMLVSGDLAAVEQEIANRQKAKKEEEAA